jgi:hypothetical protein
MARSDTIPTDEEYEATRLKYYPNDPKQGKPVKNQRGNYVIEEVVHHGDYRHVRIVEVDTLDRRTVGAAVRSGPYIYNCEDDSPQVARVLADLLLGRVNRSHGWSTFRVVHISMEPDFSLHVYDDYRNED